jgi:biopolymer transport protein ExbD
MAGVSVGEAPDNPVAINITAMVDIIFCLCVFFMCSLHFKQLEGKFDTWLPKGKGVGGVADASSILQEIRIAMFYDPNTEKTTRQYGTRKYENDDELSGAIKAAYDDFVLKNRPDVPVTIDADGRVPWDEVIKVVNLCKRNQIGNIEFALGAPPPAGG